MFSETYSTSFRLLIRLSDVVALAEELNSCLSCVLNRSNAAFGACAFSVCVQRELCCGSSS